MIKEIKKLKNKKRGFVLLFAVTLSAILLAMRLRQQCCFERNKF